MATDLRDKLRRLGVHKGARSLNPTRTHGGSKTGGIEMFVAGRLVDTPHGSTFLHEETYDGGHLHGDHALGELLSLSPAIAARIGNEPALEQIELSRVAFLDTETTGLASGTGTLAFLIGVGTFEMPAPNFPTEASPTGAGSYRHTLTPNSSSSFLVRQFFLRNPAEEPAMLHALAEWLDSFEAVVSFNGRGFDLPLLHTRFTLARMRPRILRAPHLDLLLPARRVWRGRLPSCALSSLEQHILNVRREQADVPGFLIPEMYVHYVRTGDGSEMPRVMYHNALDILSMVSLSTRLITLFGPAASPNGAPRSAGDWLALGKWYDDLGQAVEAEAALRACLDAQPDPACRAAALHRLGRLLKRQERRAEAVRVWEALSASKTWESVEACIELAKHHEWHAGDVERALSWTREAVATLSQLPASYVRDRFEAELAHRLERLERKRQMC